MRQDRSWTARLQADVPLSPVVRHLTLRVDVPEGFHWLPGQYVELFDPSSPSERFPYSLASAEQPGAPGRFELAVRCDASAGAVERLRVGDAIAVAEPRGSFVRAGDRLGRAVFVAIGTGVAPVRAMIQSAFAHPGSEQLLLLFGCRSEQELLWAQELNELASHPRFSFVPTLSRPGAEWRGRRGYVQAHLGELSEFARDADFYVCGSKTMVGESAQKLMELGVPSHRLWLEGY